jgi:hypothetical protein
MISLIIVFLTDEPIFVAAETTVICSVISLSMPCRKELQNNGIPAAARIVSLMSSLVVIMRLNPLYFSILSFTPN